MVILAVCIAVFPPLVLHVPFYNWIYKALVLLVIACPCALVISTPVTVVSGLAAAARNGILIKGGAYLEIGHKLKAVAFDKTGTLTKGKQTVTDVITLSNISQQNLLHLAASIEIYSEHPVSDAIVKKHKELLPNQNLFVISNFEAIPGCGVTGIKEEDGEQYFVGNHRFAEDNKICNLEIEQILEKLEQSGKTSIIIFTKQNALGILAVSDTIRESSKCSLNTLHKLGIETIMLTGDNLLTAEVIAKDVGINKVYANMLPRDKLNAIDKLLAKYNFVGMVGDGINDAPALAKATIGFTMGRTGSDIALETADVTLMEDNLYKLPLFIKISHKTVNKLLQNITFSIAIKIIALITGFP
jgi:Cd2+/Zn2+-exporting ATPase